MSIAALALATKVLSWLSFFAVLQSVNAALVVVGTDCCRRKSLKPCNMQRAGKVRESSGDDFAFPGLESHV